MIASHAQGGAYLSLEHPQCGQPRRMTVTKIRIIDQADCLRMLMNFVAFLAERKAVPLFFGETQDEIL